MLYNYLKTAVRNLLRHKAYSLINVLGLAIGMAAFVLIALFIYDEWSYDRYHQKADRIFRLAQQYTSGDEILRSAAVPPVLAPTLKEHFPEVIEVARFIRQGGEILLSRGEQRFFENEYFYADGAVFDVFDFEFIYGDPATALSEPNAVVVTETLARKYFGNSDPMGGILALDQYDGKIDLRVTGVLSDIPHNSHLKFDALISAHTPESYLARTIDKWWAPGGYVYVLMPEQGDVADLEGKFPSFTKEIGQDLGLFLQPLTDIHLSPLDTDFATQGSMYYLFIFSAIASLIIVIACVNFVNLSTARAGQRAREVGVRKVVGARRTQLICQFLGETILLCGISLVLALGLVELTLPAFNAIFGKGLALDHVDHGAALVAGLLLTLGIGLVAGAYSAFVLSAFRPVQVLKGVFCPGYLNTWLRQGLVVFQFSASIVLIVCTAVIYIQMRYVQDKALGFAKEQVVLVSYAYALEEQYESFKNELLVHSGVQSVTSGNVPGMVDGMTFGTRVDGKAVNVLMYDVDYDFVETLGLKLIQGRSFGRSDGENADEVVIVNEEYVRLFGRDEESYKQNFGDEGELRIVGVVQNFHARSLHQKIQPVAMRLKPGGRFYTLVRVHPHDTPGTLEFLKKKWAAFVPERPFAYSFLDQDWAKMYREEQQLGRIMGSFAALAIFVACLGLFGLASFAAERRTKEIGIRKILGASVANIVLLLSNDFTKLVVVANAIAWPLAYYAMQHWLQNFAYRIELGVEHFLLGGVIALAIAWLTVGWQALRAALANPVDALRYE